MAPSFDTIDLHGMDIARVDERSLLDHLFAELACGRGGWIITANLDFMRRWATDPSQRALYASADVRVADGMPLLWAARLQGDHLPQRVTGSGLVWTLCERAAREGRGVFLLGGDEGAAQAAAGVLTERYAGLRVVGTANPWIGSPPSEAEVEAMRDAIGPVHPDVVLVGFGSPKQEWVIERLRASFPRTWFIGVGVSFSFVAGMIERAPAWAQRVGLEWAHRLAQEPRRLARRYLIEDLPFSARLFARAAARRVQRRMGGGR